MEITDPDKEMRQLLKVANLKLMQARSIDEVRKIGLMVDLAIEKYNESKNKSK